MDIQVKDILIMKKNHPCGCNTFEELRIKMGESLQAYCDERGEMDLQDRLLRQAAETLELTVTDEMLTDALDEQVRNLAERLLKTEQANIEEMKKFL